MAEYIIRISKGAVETGYIARPEGELFPYLSRNPDSAIKFSTINQANLYYTMNIDALVNQANLSQPNDERFSRDFYELSMVLTKK